MVVDAHHHLWRYRPGFKPWMEGDEKLAPLRRDFLGRDLGKLIAKCGVDRTVIVQAGDSLEDTAFMIDRAHAHKFIAGIVGWAPLDDPHATEKALNIYELEPRVKGLRHMIIWEPDQDWLVRPTVLESLALVAERGYTWDSTATTSRHLEHVSTIADKLPQLMHVIDHLGKPAASEGQWEPWASLMRHAAEFPNVYVKLSGFFNASSLANATVEQFRPYVQFVLERFGAHRVMMASNWPVCMLGADYPTTWQQTLSLIEGLSDDARAEVMGGTATRFYNL